MTIDQLQSVSKIMALELERRFTNLLDPAHENHNSLYMVATLLDQRFKNFLEEEHIAYAPKECIKLLCNGDYESDCENAASSSQLFLQSLKLVRVMTNLLIKGFDMYMI